MTLTADSSDAQHMGIVDCTDRDHCSDDYYYVRCAEIDLEQAKKWYDLSPIVHRYGTWAVTKYGIECLANYYPIKKDRLWEIHWVQHMSTKRRGVYGYIEDFKDCLEAARICHGPQPIRAPKPPKPAKVMVVKEPKPTKIKMIVTLRDRFVILKRDKYRCRICGRNADDGVKLHIDHIIAKSKGGTAEYVNLWTLCDECNHGKYTDEL